jgi:hypothetical protein
MRHPLSTAGSSGLSEGSEAVGHVHGSSGLGDAVEIRRGDLQEGEEISSHVAQDSNSRRVPRRRSTSRQQFGREESQHSFVNWYGNLVSGGRSGALAIP